MWLWWRWQRNIQNCRKRRTRKTFPQIHWLTVQFTHTEPCLMNTCDPIVLHAFSWFRYSLYAVRHLSLHSPFPYILVFKMTLLKIPTSALFVHTFVWRIQLYKLDMYYLAFLKYFYQPNSYILRSTQLNSFYSSSNLYLYFSIRCQADNVSTIIYLKRITFCSA